MADKDLLGFNTVSEEEKADVRAGKEERDILGLPKYNPNADT